MQIKRIDGLDIFRGLAILLMISYHFSYDLNHFGIITADLNHNSGFLIARYTIMSMFILGVGMSLALAHEKAIKWKNFRKRILQLGLASFAVTLATYVVFPNNWVYFGILHFILLGSLIVLPLLKFPKTTLFLAICILLGSATNFLHLHTFFNLIQTPLALPKHSEDLVPLIPWLGVMLLGMSLVQYKYHQKIFSHKLFNLNFSVNKVLKKIGQNSLVIYLIHQPILFLGFELYFIIFSK